MRTYPLRAAVLGTGNIGVDLGVKISQNPNLQLVAVAGRRSSSTGLRRLAKLSNESTDRGLEGLLQASMNIDVFFDATNAESHRRHWKLLEPLDSLVIDLTPSRVGSPTVPRVLTGTGRNFSMITCGGQASIPLIQAIRESCDFVRSVEVSSSIASRSAGPATRVNIDDYIFATENAARMVSGAPRSKAILILNPVEPPTLMRTTVQAEVDGLNDRMMHIAVNDAIAGVQTYVPGYELAFAPRVDSGLVSVTVKVTGAGDFLPPWAGNLDIITAAAVETAVQNLKGSLQ